jgi:hypothetical protein
MGAVAEGMVPGGFAGFPAGGVWIAGVGTSIGGMLVVSEVGVSMGALADEPMGRLAGGGKAKVVGAVAGVSIGIAGTFTIVEGASMRAEGASIVIDGATPGALVGASKVGAFTGIDPDVGLETVEGATWLEVGMTV